MEKSALDSGNFFEVINRLQKYEDDLVFANGMSDYLWIPYILTAILTMLQKVYLPILLVSLLFVYRFLCFSDDHVRTSQRKMMRFTYDGRIAYLMVFTAL